MQVARTSVFNFELPIPLPSSKAAPARIGLFVEHYVSSMRELWLANPIQRASNCVTVDL
jgi:hypothetical protein